MSNRESSIRREIRTLQQAAAVAGPSGNRSQDNEGKAVPVRSKGRVRTIFKWTAVTIGGLFTLFVAIGLSGVLDRTPEERAKWELEKAARLAGAEVNDFSGVELKLVRDVSSTVTLDNPVRSVTFEDKAADYVGHFLWGLGQKSVDGNNICIVRDKLYEARSALDDPSYRWDDRLPDGTIGSLDEFPCDALAPVTDDDRRIRVPYENLTPGANPLSAEGNREIYRSVDEQLLKLLNMMTTAQSEYRPIPVFGDHVWACSSEQAYRDELGQPGNTACRIIRRYTAPDLIDPLDNGESAFYRLQMDIGGGQLESFVVHKADVMFAPAFPRDGIQRSTNCKAIPAAEC